jgi:hypothetical protein
MQSGHLRWAEDGPVLNEGQRIYTSTTEWDDPQRHPAGTGIQLPSGTIRTREVSNELFRHSDLLRLGTYKQSCQNGQAKDEGSTVL